MSILLVLGQNISEQRKKMGISQKDLAKLLGITQDALSRIEKGKMAPKMTRLEDFAHIFKCPVSFLFLTDFEKVHFYDRVLSECLKRLTMEGRVAIIELVKHAVDVMSLDFSVCPGNDRPRVEDKVPSED
ncbi:MAG: helix-turn-helix domain-containing protein [Desulfovibrio sp.]|nr:helix-turn-helix domain-containing protein [Desulfovibrio sp.]